MCAQPSTAGERGGKDAKAYFTPAPRTAWGRNHHGLHACEQNAMDKKPPLYEMYAGGGGRRWGVGRGEGGTHIRVGGVPGYGRAGDVLCEPLPASHHLEARAPHNSVVTVVSISEKSVRSSHRPLKRAGMGWVLMANCTTEG